MPRSSAADVRPSRPAEDRLACDQQVEVLPDDRSAERGIYTVYPSRKQLAPKVRLMVDFLAAAFERPDWPA